MISMLFGEKNISELFSSGKTVVPKEPLQPAASQHSWSITLGTMVLCSCFLRKPVGFKMMILMFLQRKHDLQNPGYILRTLILLVENYLNSVATPHESIKPVVRNISTGGTASLLQHWKIHQEKRFSHCLRGFLKWFSDLRKGKEYSAGAIVRLGSNKQNKPCLFW